MFIQYKVGVYSCNCHVISIPTRIILWQTKEQTSFENIHKHQNSEICLNSDDIKQHWQESSLLNQIK